MESWLNYLKTAPQEIKLNKSISILHPYLEGRLSDVANKQYPRHHLWGINAIEELNHSDISMIEVKKFKLPKIFERFFNRLILRRSSDVRLELAGLTASTRTDLTYSVCGPLAFKILQEIKTCIMGFPRLPRITRLQLYILIITKT